MKKTTIHKKVHRFYLSETDVKCLLRGALAPRTDTGNISDQNPVQFMPVRVMVDTPGGVEDLKHVVVEIEEVTGATEELTNEDD